jgi:hypothetical protein
MTAPLKIGKTQGHPQRRLARLSTGNPREQGIDLTKRLNGTYNPLWVMHDLAYDCFELYRTVFDPTVASAELAKLDAEHGRQMEKWDQAPTPLYKEKAKARLDALEGRIQELKRQQQDAAEAVAGACRELHELQLALCDAREALRSEGGEHALRRRAEAVRRALRGGKIVVEFEATGRVKTSYKNPRTVPTRVRYQAWTWLPIRNMPPGT